MKLKTAFFGLFLGFLLSGSLACSKPNGIEPYHYILFSVLREGLNRPTTPTNFTGSYNNTLEQISLEWGASTDPDTGFPIGLYRLYLYQNLPPTVYYRSEDLFDESALTAYNISQTRFSGSLFFVVTAFDGGVESLPSSTVEVNVLNKSSL